MAAHAIRRALALGLVAALAGWTPAAHPAPPASPAIAIAGLARAARGPAPVDAPPSQATAAIAVPAVRTADVDALAARAAPVLAIVVADATPLRAAPHDTAMQQALLWGGDVLEVRGERLDHLQVYDHLRERGGFVATARVRRLRLEPAQAPELLAVLRFLHDTPGAEAVGIGYAAAWLRAASPAQVQGPEGAEALEALGTFADRLARRASSSVPASRAAQDALAAHLQSAARHGVRFVERERDGRVRLCYDGEAHARVLALASTPAQQARAALALTEPACVDPDLGPTERRRDDEQRVALLDRVDARALPAALAARVAMRRAALWSGLAFARARQGDAAAALAAERRALSELAAVDPSTLSDADRVAYADAAMRVNASRWVGTPPGPASRGTGIVLAEGPPGETCVLLVDAKHDASAPLLRRCTYAQVFAASATLNREGNALALAVQPTPSWRELWVFRRTRAGWFLQVLPPAASGPDVGYAEFAGWVPGGRRLLVARESRVEGRTKRSFEVVRLDDLATERQSHDATALGPFQRWSDAAWKRESVALRDVAAAH